MTSSLLAQAKPAVPGPVARRCSVLAPQLKLAPLVPRRLPQVCNSAHLRRSMRVQRRTIILRRWGATVTTWRQQGVKGFNDGSLSVSNV